MNKKIRILLLGFLSLILLGKAVPAYSFSDATFYHSIDYCVNIQGAGTVYANGPKYENYENSSYNYPSTSSISPTTAEMSKYTWKFGNSAPTSVEMFYTLYASNTNNDYQFDHWEKKDGNTWVKIEQNPVSLSYAVPSFEVKNKQKKPKVSTSYRAFFSLKGVLKAEVAEGQEHLGNVTNSKVNNTNGDNVTLTAKSTQSFEGVTFSHWTIDGNTEYRSEDNPINVTVPDNVTSIVYRAHFTEPSGYTYCRFENVGTGETGRFLSLSNYPTSSKATIRREPASGGYRYTALELNALALLENTSKSMGDPSTVFYIAGTSDNAEGLSEVSVLKSQNVDVSTIIDVNDKEYKLKIKKEGQYYRISTTMVISSDGDTGEVFLTDEGKDIPVFSNTKDNSSLWKIHYLDDDHIGEHSFGVAPDSRMFQNGKYYTTLYTTFPYKMLDGIKAYYLDITKAGQIYNEQSKKITFLEADDEDKIIPKNMAVILECNGTSPEGNRLLPIVDNNISEDKYVTDKNNPLKGALVVGGNLTGESAARKSKLPESQNYVYVYSAINGLVSFYKWTGNDKVIPNNKVYLAVTKDFEGDSSSDGNAAKGYTFVWGLESEDNSATGIDNIVQVEEDGTIYNLQGSKVTNPSAGVYIKNGKKIVVK